MHHDPKSQQSSNSPFASALIFFGLGFLLVNLGQPLGIGQLPLAFLLKDHFGYSASQVALFSAVITIPFYLKPLAGLFADTFLRHTTHRKQLTVASLLVIVFWLLVALSTRQPAILLISLFVLVGAVVFANTVLGGLLVEFGQREGATGRLSAIRISVEGLGVALAGLIGGQLAGKPFGYTAGICALCFLGVSLSARKLHVSQDTVKEAVPLRTQIELLLGARDLWLIVAILFLVLIAPGLRTTLLYFQTDQLHFAKTFIGSLSFINGISALLGAALYAKLCRSIPIRPLLWFGVASYILSTLFYIAYRNSASAIIVEALNGFALASAGLPILDLAVRSCPKGLEASAFGVILSVTNIALAISDILGATLYSHYHISFYSMVPLNLATTLLAIPLVLRLPKRLTYQQDR